MEANWKVYEKHVDPPTIVYIEGVKTTQSGSWIFYRARIEVTAEFDGMMGKRGFEYMKKFLNWTEIDGIGNFGLKEDEYKYIDDGFY